MADYRRILRNVYSRRYCMKSQVSYRTGNGRAARAQGSIFNTTPGSSSVNSWRSFIHIRHGCSTATESFLAKL